LNKNEIIKRLKSSVVWTGVISYILAILSTWGIDDVRIKITLVSILGVLVLFGFLNNPGNKEGF
jgi:uncharacterized membrane protein